MATWTISNVDKKNAVELQFWQKDGVVIEKAEGFRWGTWYCECDEKPDIDLSNPDGYNLSYTDYDWEMDMMSDGCWLEWTFPDTMSEDEREQIESAWNEDTYEGLESLGWINDDTEYWIHGPLHLVNEDTKEEFTGED